MKTNLLEREDFVPHPLEKVFQFFENPENLQVLTPPSLHFKILTPTPLAMRRGLKIDYRIGLLGLPLRWTSEITLYEPPYRFIDEQICGPYRYWQHLHEFESRDGGTWMRDSIRYRVPGGNFAWPIQRIFVQRQLKLIFDYRKRKLHELFP